MIFHESLDTFEAFDLRDPDPEPEPVDDGPVLDEVLADLYELGTHIDSEPALDECGFCAGDCLTPFGPIVEGVPDGHVVRRRGEWRYACDGCVDDAVEAGWFRE